MLTIKNSFHTRPENLKKLPNGTFASRACMFRGFITALSLLSSLLLQDDKYWQRRKKNNVAAKRSRDARRLKENQITVRAAFLERENVALRTEVADLRKDCSRYKSTVGCYEAKFGKL